MKNILFLSLFISCSSVADQFRLGFGLGQSDIDVDRSADVDFLDSSQDAASIYFRVGYVLTNGLLVDLEHVFSSNDFLFGANDNVTLDSTSFFLGYKSEKDKYFFIPRIGYTNWDVRLDEAGLFSPGQEITINEDGSDPALSISAGRMFSSKFGLSLSYNYLDFDYGKAQSYFLDFAFEF